MGKQTTRQHIGNYLKKQGISHNDIELEHFMDLNYFKYENNLQVFTMVF